MCAKEAQRRRRRPGRDTEPKTRTPHKDVGYNIVALLFQSVAIFLKRSLLLQHAVIELEQCLTVFSKQNKFEQI